MKARTAAVAGALVALLFVSIVVYFAASVNILGSPDDFSPTNSAWNGFSTFAAVEHPTVLRNLSALPPDGTGFTLLENGPSGPYSSVESKDVSSFVASGGSLVLADDQDAYANSLLSGMGLSSRFSGGLLTDPLFNFRNSYLVVAPTVSMYNVTSHAFDNATTLTVSAPGSQVLAYSSDFSYLYPSQPGASIASAPHGPFPVVAAVPDGKGRVYMIADDSVFINSMISRDGNTNLLKDVSTGAMLLVTSHFSVSPAASFRKLEATVYSTLSLPELKYSAVVFGLAAVLAYRFGQKPSMEENELKTVMQEHPEWSDERLRRLREETGRP